MYADIVEYLVSDHKIQDMIFELNESIDEDGKINTYSRENRL